ncbi:protein N-terminal and lysine N-methyltransferase efm7 isoform X2 [Magnolia sinica]|uniref:protein N-terminal and lysine N-methyltransferase efm7 isoform X2 n=1 Tax=Magnolia sinica TaxID=86752 RepID=UPI00265990D2|nr:protein N-terminal and lysine N-methyltransferase efm7 isoform X2 [Magnolia sinica]
MSLFSSIAIISSPLSHLGPMFFSSFAFNLLLTPRWVIGSSMCGAPAWLDDPTDRLVGHAVDADIQTIRNSALLLNNYLSKNVDILKGCSVVELGSGVGITGILCSRFCREVVLTDHNEEVLKILNKNIELHQPSETPDCVGLVAEKLEWGNADDISRILQKYSGGFDLVLGADICFQQSSIPPLFDTVEQLLRFRKGSCKFILGYVSRAKIMDTMVVDEATRHGMQISEVHGTRSVVGNLEGVIFEVSLH